MTNEIQQFNQQGGWTTPHRFYFPMAKNLLQQAKELYSQLEDKEKELKKKVKSEETIWDENTIAGYIQHLTNDDNNYLDAICVSTQIFACMAVEAFLNFYGVKRLGEEYYKRSIERLGISQKLETLIAICTQKLIDDKDEISTTVRRMFDRRNRLAHPKSREVFSKNGKLVLPEFINHMEQAEQAVSEMIVFFNKFQELDESMEFDNPNNITNISNSG